MVAMGQRNAGIGGTGRRSRDAGHHLAGDAMTAQIGQFLAAAPEDERVSALQPDHPQAGLRVFEQPAIDHILRGAGRTRRLTHFDPLGIAPSQGQNGRTDQAVVQDDVGLLQPAQRLETEQTGIAGTGPDQRHPARRTRLGTGQGLGEGRLGPRITTASQPVADLAIEQGFQETAADRHLRQACPDARLPAADQGGQRSERIIQHLLDPLADLARQHRGRTATRHRHLDRTARNHRRHLDTAQFGRIDDIAEDPARLGLSAHLGIDRPVIGRSNHQPGTLQMARLEPIADRHEPSLAYPRTHRLAQIGGDHLDPGAGVQQGIDLARRHHTGPHHQYPTVTKIGEQRKQARSGHGSTRRKTTRTRTLPPGPRQAK